MDKTQTYIIFIPIEDIPMAEGRAGDLWLLYWEGNRWRSQSLVLDKLPDNLTSDWVNSNPHRIYPNVTHLRILRCAQCDAPSYSDYLCKECRNA